MRRVSAKDRIRQFLVAHTGEVVTSYDLRAAVGPGVTEWARRLRELRNDDGWPIRSNNDDDTLRPGEYRLDSLPEGQPLYTFAASLSSRVRAEVLERNGYTCQMCGVGAGEDDDVNPGRKVRLHIGHIVDRSHGGSDQPSNLRALCSTCNQGAKNLVQEPPSWTWLRGQIRRATENDQREMLRWLKRKFED